MSAAAPVRTCVVCGGRRPRADLLRLVLDASGRVALDASRSAPGRGAHVCPGCLGEVHFTKRLQKAFRGRAAGLGPGFAQSHTPGNGRKADRAREGRRPSAEGCAAE